MMLLHNEENEDYISNHRVSLLWYYYALRLKPKEKKNKDKNTAQSRQDYEGPRGHRSLIAMNVAQHKIYKLN